MTFVLDASAVIRLLDGEAGSQRVRWILRKAFGVELAADSAEHILVTADFDVKPAERDVHIEFLPVKLKP